MNLTKYEQEIVINFNAGEDTASLYTIQLILSGYARWMDLLRRIHSYSALLGKMRSAKPMSFLKS